MDNILKEFKSNLEKKLELNLSHGKIFKGKFNLTDTNQVHMGEFLKEIKNAYGVKNKNEIKGIYKIYIKRPNEDNELFYIGISKSSVYDRLKRHYKKYNKSEIEGSPKRYTFFRQLHDDNNEVTIEIIRIEGKEKLNYLFLIEELLTLIEEPKYILDINNEVKVNSESVQND